MITLNKEQKTITGSCKAKDFKKQIQKLKELLEVEQ